MLFLFVNRINFSNFAPAKIIHIQMITVSNLAIQFGTRVLYKDVNLQFTSENIYGVTPL